MPEATKPLNEIYATIAGPVSEVMVQKIFHNLSLATQERVDRIHLLFHSTGGLIGDGIALYNYIRRLPVEVVIYNSGWVQSIGVVVFLGAAKRKASQTASFMVHKAHFSTGFPASSHQLQGITDSLTMHDANIESILKAHITMPPDKWVMHAHADLYITAAQALEYSLIDGIADFAPPLGRVVYNLLQ